MPAVAIAWLLPYPALALETGTTRVAVTFDRTRVFVEIVLDPDALMARLDHHMRVEPVDGAFQDARLQELATRITARRDELLRQITVQFDQTLAALQLDEVSLLPMSSDQRDLLSSPRVRLRFTGSAPSGARTFRWAYGLTYAPYTLTVKQAHVTTTAVVDGAQLSPTFDLQQARSTNAARTADWGLTIVALSAAIWLRGRSNRKRRVSVQTE
jgi:hypothetical protein